MPRFRHILALALFIYAQCSTADWINLTGSETAPNIAEIYVMDDHVKLVLEVYVGDLEKFRELVPDDWLGDQENNRPSLERRMHTFATQRFKFVTSKGEALPARLQLVEPRMRVDRQSPFAGMINPLTRQRVPDAPADKRVLYAEIIYPFDGKPEQLTFVPPLDETGVADVSIGFIAYHKSVPIIDFRYLGQPALLHLNWNDPWYTAFDNPNLKRHHKSALMSFLYVEPYEVRHEILTRVQDMGNWMDLGLRDEEYIEIDELEPLKQRIGEFLLTKNPVDIDGKRLKPILDRSNYVKVSMTGITLLERPERLEVSTAIIGVIITYLTDGLPQQVNVDWELFDERIERIPAMATDPAGPLRSYISRDDNVFNWTNYLKKYKVPTVDEVAVKGSLGEISVPVLSLVCGLVSLVLLWLLWQKQRTQRSLRMPGAALVVTLVTGIVALPYLNVVISRPALMAADLNDEQSQVLLQAMLKNVYRAFDFREEQDVYDKLALSVDGDLLADIYLQNRKSFAVQKAGGAQARVKDVQILSASAEQVDGDGLTYRIRGNWTAIGTVGHWGHIHTRQNLYDAILKVAAVEGKWKITELQLLEEKRIEPGTQTGQQPAPSTS
jgi:hypothetical protein